LADETAHAGKAGEGGSDGSSAPIFVIGSPRSGTTLVRLILDTHPRISCGEETHFLRDLETIVGRNWELVATYGLPRAWWLEHIRSLYLDFQGEVLTRSGKARWAEKDPTYTLHLAFIEELFPGALYVHLLRDGHDVVASFRDRWGYTAAARAARSEWARYVNAARALGARLPPERFCELRYEALVSDPEREAQRLFAFLGISTPPFWLALLLIIVFSVVLGVLPAGGTGAGGDVVDRARYLLLPVLALTLAGVGSYVRYVRAAMLETLGREWIRTARAKGLSERRLLLQHALRPAMLPVVTLIGIANLPATVARQRRAVRMLGLTERYAASLPIGIGAAALEGDAVAHRMIEVGHALIDDHGADVLIMGCAGMARHRTAVEQALGVPVIDPTQAAAAQAVAAVRIGAGRTG